MSKIITLIIIFVTLIGLLLSPSSAFADDSGTGTYQFKGNNFTYYVSTKKANDPPEYPYIQTNTILGLANNDSKTASDIAVKINIYADKPFFVPLSVNEYYHFKLDSNDQNCSIGNDKIITGYTQYNLEVTTKIKSTCLTDKYWHAWKVSFWAGGFTINPNRSNTFTEFYLYVVPPNKTWPIITAENPILNYNDKPRVRVSNISKGIWYTLWWDGSPWPAEAPSDDKKYGTYTNSKFKVDNDNDVNDGITVILNSPVRDFAKTNTTKQLNIIVGEQKWLGGAKALSKTFFTFIAGATPPLPKTCTVFPKDNPTEDDSVSLKATGMDDQKSYTAYAVNQESQIVWKFPNTACTGNPSCHKEVLYFPFGKLPEGKYKAYIDINESPSKKACPPENAPEGSSPIEFEVGKPVPAAASVTLPCKDNNCSKSGGDICDPDDKRGPGFKTAIGCIHTNPTELTKDILKFGVGIGGGLAFLMMLLGAFQMLTSAGNPETLNAGKERLTSAVIGLLFVIFSILLLKIIGVDILGLGGQFGYKP